MTQLHGISKETLKSVVILKRILLFQLLIYLQIASHNLRFKNWLDAGCTLFVMTFTY